jgi:2-dehydropantoate 2-reductase
VKRKKAIADRLTIITDENEITVFPNIVSDDPLTIGKLDYLICATKHDMKEVFFFVRKNASLKTLILPLYNGVDAQESDA